MPVFSLRKEREVPSPDLLPEAGGTGRAGGVSVIYVRHVVGRCPICGDPFLDSGHSDDPDEWEHSLP